MLEFQSSNLICILYSRQNWV